MRLTTLGTSCAQQTLSRTQSAHALSISPAITYLFDCGSSTATTLLQAGIKPNTIQKVFITHLHTDHVVGLTGLLTDILGGHGGRIEDFKAGTKREGTSRRVVDVYGPSGIKEFLRTTFRLTYTILAQSFRIHELLMTYETVDTSPPYLREEGSRDVMIEGDGVWRDISLADDCGVTAVPITHSVPSLGYIITETNTISIPPEYVAQIREHIAPGSQEFRDAMKLLKSGELIVLPSTTLGPLQQEKGRQVVILGDTSDASAVLPFLARPVSLVLHESTNAYLPSYAKPSDSLSSVRERAIERGHSTPEMAGEFARQCDAQILVLTHFSSRYSGADVKGAVKVMQAFEKLAALAGSATQESVQELFEHETTPKVKRRQREHPSDVNQVNVDGQYRGRTIAAWDGMFIDIPRTKVYL